MAGALAVGGFGQVQLAHAAPAEARQTGTSPALPSVEDEPGVDPLPDVSPHDHPEVEPGPEVESSDPDDSPGTADESESKTATETPEGRVEPPAPSMTEPTVVRVAVGLASELDGAKSELQLLERLEQAMATSPNPSADVRRLRVGSADAPDVCREGLDDLVIQVGYLPDRDEPVLMTRDCRIDENLGIRSSAAAGDPALLEVLWAEHTDRVANGARERRRARVSPKVRTGLIAGAAVLVIGAAIGLLIAGAVRRDNVVIVVSPTP